MSENQNIGFKCCKQVEINFSLAVLPLHGGNLVKDVSLEQRVKDLAKNDVNLPSFSGILESTLSQGKLLQVDGTNVVRVPFGVREPRRKRPHHTPRLATLVLPFQTSGSPNPPPHAA